MMRKPPDSPKKGSPPSGWPISPGVPFSPEDNPPALEGRIDQLERFRGLLEHSHDMILLVHLDSRRIVDVNASACRQLDYTPEELRSMAVGEIVAMNRLRWLDAAGDPSAAGRVTTVLGRKGGSEIPVEISFSMDDFDGSAYVVTIARDISSRIKSELALKQHKILLNSVLNHTDNAILALDSDLRVIYYNEQYLKLYPFDRPYMDSRPTVNALIRRACEVGLYPPDQADALIARRLEQLDRAAEHTVIETPRLDGIMIEATASWLPGGGFLLTFRDITERKRAEEALRESEEKFRSIFENSAAGMATFSLEGRFLQVNPALCRLLGYAEEELLRLTLKEVTHPGDWNLMGHHYDEVRAGKRQAFDYEKRYLRKDGSILWGHATVACVRRSDRTAAYCVGMVQDITDRRSAENRLRESEERFRSIFRSAAVGMATLSAEGNILQANPAFCRTAGYAEDELLGMNVLDGTHPDDRTETLRLYDDLRSGRRKAIKYEKRYVQKDGAIVWGYASVAGVFDANRKLRYSVALIQDVTDRKLAESAVLESEERFRTIFETAAAGMATFSPAGKFLQVNPHFCRFIGYSEAELLHFNIAEITHPEDREETRRRYDEVMAGRRQVIDYEKRYIRKDGAVVWGHATVACVHDASSKPSYCVGLLQDITERKKAEEVLRESDRMKTEFISTAAHELRTPLTSIQGFSQVLLAQPDISPAEQKEFLSYIHERSAALSRTMDDLLDIARLESGQELLLDKTVCSAGELFRKVGPMMEIGISAHRFEKDLRGEDTLLAVDKGKVVQVLENLFSNAMKYSPAGGLIRVEGGTENGIYRFAIIDEGIGMTPEQVDKIFDKFYRVDASNTAVGGVGLGMSIVKNIVEAHGGRIWVKSAPAEGTTVNFTLPLADERRSEGSTPRKQE